MMPPARQQTYSGISTPIALRPIARTWPMMIDMNAQEGKEKRVVVELWRIRVGRDADVKIGAGSGCRKMIAVDKKLGERAADTTGSDESSHIDGDAESRNVFEAELLLEDGCPCDRRSRASG